MTQEEIRKNINTGVGKITIVKPRDRNTIRTGLKPQLQEHIDNFYMVWSILNLKRNREDET